MRLLPGRIAVLVPVQREDGLILIPDAVWQKWSKFGKFHGKKHEDMVAIGEVVATGRPRDRVPMPRVGEAVVVLDKPGLQIEHNDVDIPGVEVPEGYTLRLYGVGDPWHDAVLTVIEESEKMVMAA